MSRLALFAGVLCVAVGCGPHVSEGGPNDDGGAGDGDGGGGGDGGSNGPHDAAIDARTIDAPPDAVWCTTRTVYVDFDGVTLSKAATTDATVDAASWLPNPSAVIPAFRPAESPTTRAADITAIVRGLQASLGGFPVAVVTTRPAAGPYVLVVIGGSEATNVGLSGDYAGYSGFDCGDAVASDVVWITDTLGTQATVNYAIGGIGLGLGLLGTSSPTDCMCSWGGTTCTPSAAACTLSTSILSPDTTHCVGTQPQNESAAFELAFCGQ